MWGSKWRERRGLETRGLSSSKSAPLRFLWEGRRTTLWVIVCVNLELFFVCFMEMMDTDSNSEGIDRSIEGLI